MMKIKCSILNKSFSSKCVTAPLVMLRSPNRARGRTAVHAADADLQGSVGTDRIAAAQLLPAQRGAQCEVLARFEREALGRRLEADDHGVIGVALDRGHAQGMEVECHIRSKRRAPREHSHRGTETPRGRHPAASVSLCLRGVFFGLIGLKVRSV